MLKAKNKKTEEEYLSFLDDTEKILSNKTDLICPICLQQVTFVNAHLKIKHFRHLVELNCNPEPETIEHLEMKKFIIEQFKLGKENVEVNLKFARPDILLKNENIAIELQHSNISEDEFILRNNNYTENGIYPLWIFHHDLLSENISALLKKAHEMYFGRVYIYKDEQIIPVHFSPAGTYVEPNDFSEHFGYWKWYKKRRELRYGNKISSYGLLKTFNDRLDTNLARFYDKQFWKDYDENMKRKIEEIPIR